MCLGSSTVDLLAGSLTVAVSDQGEGRPFLLLHAGAGPAVMSGLSHRLAECARAIVPTHPGFAGTVRPDWLHRIDQLALAYLALIERFALDDVVIVGNSIGGWIAAEMALRGSPRIASVVLMNAVGIDMDVDGFRMNHPADTPPEERAKRSFHDPKMAPPMPSDPELLAIMASNLQALCRYAGDPFMYDPTLRGRLVALCVPSLVLWGEADQIVDLNYGRVFGASIPGARFEVVRAAGHFPQLEQPDVVAELIRSFVS